MNTFVAMVFGLLLPLNIGAKTFRNTYLTFEIPENWSCQLEGIAWVCSPKSVIENKEALLVVTAKMAGPDDTLLGFEKYLRKPKALSTKTHAGAFSKFVSLEHKKMTGLEWIQSIHIGSEIPEFQTTYAATVKEGLAILVSFSFDTDYRGKYEKIFSTLFTSMKIDAAQALAEIRAQDQARVVLNSPPLEQVPPPPAAGLNRKNNRVWLIGGLLIGLGLLVILARISF